VSGLLEGKRLLITGVVNRHSIAYAIAEGAQRQGAEIVLTSFGRVRRLTERAVKHLPEPVDVLELDVDSDADLKALREALSERWGHLDGAVHAIAFAPADALGGNFLDAPRESAAKAFETSAYSLKALAEALQPLFAARNGSGPSGGSIVGLDFDASVAWPSYDWMGVAKAGLESVSRYLARDLGPHGVRVNLISAGPISTPAASGIPGFDGLVEHWNEAAPLGWDRHDATPVADTALFLLSDLARAISGEIIHVDGGAHAVAAVAPAARAAEAAGAGS
jgi:enoyl-[acyl-carrier protein] reductase I